MQMKKLARKDEFMKSNLRKIVDFMECQAIPFYLLLTIAIIASFVFGGCSKQSEQVEVSFYEIYYTQEEMEEPIQEPVLNLCDPYDVQSEKLGQVLYLDDVPLSRDIQKFIFDECDKKDISPFLIFAIIEKESNYTSDAIGDKGKSYGLMQIQKQWHKDRMKELGVTNLLDPKQNAKVGIDVLRELFEEYTEVGYVLHCYNGGQAYANRLSKKGITSNYASAILAKAEELERSVYDE